jgi:chitin disaccharide deacetylase
MNSNSIRLVTRADDLGSYQSANRAIYDAYKKGILRNSSIIVPGEHFEEAAEMFRGEKDFCVGLHAAITCEWNNVRWKPLLAESASACFVDHEGALHKSVQTVQDSGRVKFSTILVELQAQLDKARKYGLDIRYVDLHMAFGWLFEGADDSRRFAEPAARWVEQEGLIYAGWGNTLPLNRLPRPEDATDRLAALVQAMRDATPGNYLLVSHPMYGDDPEVLPATYGNAKPGRIAAERDIERRMFMDPAVLEVVRERGIEPIRYDAL